MSKPKKEKVQWKNQLVNLVAIIIGVYAAFYLTERGSAANSRRQADTYLASIADDLRADIQQLTSSTDTLRYFMKVSKTLTRSVARQRIPQDSLGEMIRCMYLIVPFIPKDNSYQSLVTAGKLDAVEDFELRKKMTELYHQHYGAIRVTDEITNQQRNELVMPYLLRNIQFRGAGLRNATQLWRDNMFANLAFSTQFSLQMKYQLDSTALLNAKQLHAAILVELAK